MLNSTASPLSGLSALSGPPYFVDLHVNPGESVSIQLFDGNETILRGPATITMISQHTFPPIPMPVQVPPGHMIQQIVDENGQLRHIILSAHPNNGNTSSSNTALMPQQHNAQQQPFPYCCCCCYSCTGTTPTAPLPPPIPPPPPPQVHHNILAFPTPPNRRRLNPMNRTFSPAGKRSAPTYLNNNSIGKSPVRSKFGSTAAPSVDGVSKVSFNNKHTTPPEVKPYELNSNRVLVGRVNQNENNCLSDSKHVLNTKAFINKDVINRALNSKEFLPNGSIMSAPRPAPPFSYTSMEEHKELNHSFDKTDCSHYDSSDKPILLEINLSSSDSRPQNNISADIVEEVDEEEEEEEKQVLEQSSEDCKHENQINVLENGLIIPTVEDKAVEKSPKIEELLTHSHETHEESLSAEGEDRTKVDSIEEINETIGQNSINYRNTRSDSQSTTSCISSQLQEMNDKNDNQNEDNISTESNLKSNGDLSLCRIQSESNQHPMDTSDSINLIECQSEKGLENVDKETDYSIESSDESQTKDSIICNKLIDEETEEATKLVSTPVVPVVQRSPKHLLPQLQLLNLTYTSLTANSVKLKWTHSEPHSTTELYAKHYIVEMWHNKWQSSGANGTDTTSQNCRIVYQGHSNNCRISHLQSQQQYSFKVRTTSDEHLVVSNVLTITTPEQQPINNKLNKKSRREVLQQQIQQQQHQIHQQQLLLQQQQQLQQHSQTRADSTEPTISSDQRCAILLLLLFTVFAMIVAVLFQQLLSD